MQFLESSVLGVRAARHVLTSPHSDTAITLFPMMHVGEARFYDEVYADALGHDVVLYEGVKSRHVTNLTRSYRWLGPSRLGLIVQPKLPQTNQGARRILADLPPEQFDRDWAAMPLGLRCLLRTAAPLVGIIRGLGLTRTRLAKGMNQDDLSARDDLLAWDRRTRHFLELVRDTRDAHLVACLRDVLAPPAPGSVAIVYGAAHMPAVTRFLAEHGGYRVTDSAWHMVFEH